MFYLSPGAPGKRSVWGTWRECSQDQHSQGRERSRVGRRTGWLRRGLSADLAVIAQRAVEQTSQSSHSEQWSWMDLQGPHWGGGWVLSTRHRVQLPAERAPDLGQGRSPKLLAVAWEGLSCELSNSQHPWKPGTECLCLEGGVWGSEWQAMATAPAACRAAVSSEYGDQRKEGPCLFPS